ncbi:hypothetical protein D910_05991 [Dendroctonus ponderosae]|uniref:Phosphoinositide phospholipase C n=1 Tax=Dendroctonus ponderosae TaxID=77166 RepID=U4UDD4_DENPD|nr:hypothetical protein D910_05991 [Dendroctonus ponderosae]
MTKKFEFDWHIPVPEPLLTGCVFDRWTEGDNVDLEQKATFKVDEYGFFIYWKSDGREGDVIELCQVSDIRAGGVPKDTKALNNLSKKHGNDVEEKSLTICSGTDYININYQHIVCPTPDIAKVFVLQNDKSIISWMRLGFSVDAKGKIPVKAIARTFASGRAERLVYSFLAELGLPSEKNDSIELDQFTFEKFYALYHKICPRNDIEELFRSINQGKGDYLSLEQMINFLNEKQRDPRLNEILYPLYDEKRAIEIIQTYETDEELQKFNRLSKDGLIRLSLCRAGLLEWQHLGRGEDEEPIITHGRAMCTDILFKDVIYAIRDTAFVTSDYPVILSFENHCCKSQQLKLARYCEEIFGDLLLKEPLPDFPLAPDVVLPPPSALKRKILIKNKRLTPDVEKRELELFRQGQFVIEDEEKEDANASADRPIPPDITAETPAPDVPPGETPDAPVTTPYTGSTTNVHPLLSSMVNYAQPIKFQSFDTAENKKIHHNMSSFSEPVGLNLLKQQAIEFVNYNKRQMSRIYPSGARANSSNYMPQVFWNAGCQMVSLNFQTSDLPMQLNQGKFEYNGNCGYLLKPDFMRRPDRIFDPFAESPVDGVIAAQCSVQVIAGQFLSDKKIGTYVEVDMYGLPTDTIRKEFRTRMVPANGLNPVYNEEPFLFRKVVLPDLAVLRFGVYDENGKLLGQRILPLDGLQAGYRHISLRTEANFPMSLPMLFCNIELKIYVPDGFEDFMAALSDPRGFRDARQKQSEQMSSMGIEVTDQKAAEKQVKKEEKKVDPIIFEPITIESIKQDKAFQKTTKKQLKDYDTLKKKQQKEKAAVQKNQCAAIEKLVKGKSKSDAVNDANVRKLVTDQTIEWSTLMERHRKQEWEFLRNQLDDQRDLLRKHMEILQRQQMTQLDAKHEKEMKEMNSQQAKQAVETAKEITNDKTLKTKKDKERRLKEKQQNNTKKFLEERKTTALKHGREKEKLKLTHDKQLGTLSHDIQKMIDMYKNEEKEYELSSKNEFFA